MLGKPHFMEGAMAAMCVAAVCVLVPARVTAQWQGAAPCCGVVRIDRANSIITAREMATGFTFRVLVKSRTLLSTLKVGDKVWANFAAKRVRLGAVGDSLCCAIIDPPAVSAPPKAATP